MFARSAPANVVWPRHSCFYTTRLKVRRPKSLSSRSRVTRKLLDNRKRPEARSGVSRPTRRIDHCASPPCAMPTSLSRVGGSRRATDRSRGKVGNESHYAQNILLLSVFDIGHRLRIAWPARVDFVTRQTRATDHRRLRGRRPRRHGEQAGCPQAKRRDGLGRDGCRKRPGCITTTDAGLGTNRATYRNDGRFQLHRTGTIQQCK